MIRKKRKKRPIEKGVVKGYDSNWEYELHTGILKDWEHHSGSIDYIVEHKYHPDFTIKFKDHTILLESKGRFWDYQEYSKYIWIFSNMFSCDKYFWRIFGNTKNAANVQKKKEKKIK